MRLPGVLGILLMVSFCQPQTENLFGIDTQSVFSHLETIGNAFGQTLAEKLVNAVEEALAGTFTTQRALELFEGLTDEEKDRAAQGIIVLVKQLEKITSAPGTKERIRTGLYFAPLILRQYVNSSPPTEPAEPENRPAEIELPPKDGVVETLKQNDAPTNTDDVQVMDSEAVRNLVGTLEGLETLSENLLEAMEQMLGAVETIRGDGMQEGGPALEDKSTSTLSQTKDKVKVRVDGTVNSVKRDEIRENVDNGGSKKRHETDKDEL